MHPVISFLQRMVQTESISGNEAKVVALYAAEAEKFGFKPVISGRNVWFHHKVNDGPTLLFNSHTDTVKPSSSWSRDPYDGAIEEGRVHGLGANDATGSVAAQFGAAVKLVEEGWQGNLVVCASCDEETGGEGMEKVVHELPKFDAAVIGEPNNFAIAAGQRGLLKGFFHVPGQRAHASRPWQGSNAIHSAATVIKAVESPMLNVPNDLTRATAQITMIEGGVQSNVLPDTVKMTIDCRTTPEFNNEQMLEHLNSAAAQVGGQFEVYSNRFKPVHTPTDSALVQAALEVCEGQEVTVFPSVCDLFWVSHVPSVVMGPGQPVRSHQADEFILIDEVLEGVETYAAIARAWLKNLS